jgi:hypothetical protein
MPMPDGTPMNEYRARRNYFLGQALAGLCANPKLNLSTVDELVRLAIRVADAPIEALARQAPPSSPVK